MSKEKEMNKICDILTKLELTIQYKNSIGMFDINKYCEDFYCGLLNKVYNYNLSNVNFEEKNSKYIDLGDEDLKICIQVTSRKDAEKIYGTLKKFNESDLVNIYDRFIFFLIAGKGDRIKKSKVAGKLSFDIENDIKNNQNVLKDIYILDDGKRKIVLDYLLQQESENPIIFDYSKIDKIKYPIVEEYLDRKVCLASIYKTLYVSESNYENLENSIRIHKRIVLLSDAGMGKSELCKKVSNIINDNVEKCAFYYRLNNYTNQAINELKPKEYKSAPNGGITFILDAFDEIEDKNKNTFIKNLNDFIDRNPETNIIVTSRTNFYKNDNYFNNFKTYRLIPFCDKDIRFFLKKMDVNYDEFMKEVLNKNLLHFLSSPLYLLKVIKKYKSVKILPNKKMFVKEMVIDAFKFDESKYITTKDLENDKDRLYKLLGIVGLCIQCLGKNTLTKEELCEIFPTTDDRKLLEYSGIWAKDGSEFSFTHNNFGEFLASEILKDFSLEDIKKLVTYENQENEIKDTWINTLSFLLDTYDGEKLKKWVLEVLPDGIAYLEKNDFDEKTRANIFKSFFEIYEQKKIWLSSNLLYGNNSNFIDFISSKEVLEFLMDKIKENRHYTIVYNALSIIMNFQNLYSKDEDIKKQMLDLSISKKYTSQSKRYALMVLADNQLIDEENLLNIIEKNKTIEDAYIRTGYFYTLEKIGLTERNIHVIFDKMNIVHKGLASVSYADDEYDKDINLLDEHIQFDKLFLNLTSYELLEKVVLHFEDLSRREILNYLSEKMLENICFSFLNIYEKNPKSFDLILRLYMVCSENYDNAGLKVIPLELDKAGLRLDLFKAYISLDKKRRFYSDYYLVDNNCLNYFIDEYIKGNYDDELAREILSSSNIDNEDYKKLNNIYFDKTGEDYLENRTRKIKAGCSKQDFFNTLFNINDFIDCFNEFKRESKLDNITSEKVKKIDYMVFEDNEKLREMQHFLWGVKKEKVINEEYIRTFNWDWVILNETYQYLTMDKNIKISEEQKNIISVICEEKALEINFENSITYKESGEGFSTSHINIYLWYFRNKFDLLYPENVLLDMLDFDWTMEDYRHVGIDYILNSVPEEKVQARIINNIKTKIMYDGVLKNQVDYCIQKQIKGLSVCLEKYLLDDKLSTYQKENVINYLLFNSGADSVVKNYLNKVNFETENLIIQKIYELEPTKIIEYLEEKLKYETEDSKIILYSKYLIKCNKLSGLKSYQKLLIKNKKDIDKSFNDSLKDALSKVNSIELLDTIIEMFLLTFNKDFKDNRFDSLYNGCKNAMINIGLSDIKNSSYDVTTKRLNEMIEKNKEVENIGFSYYIIEELKQKYNQLNQPNKDISSIVQEINVIFAKNRRSKGIVF